MDLRCKKCERWLGRANGDCATIIKCGNCKANNQFVVHFMGNPYGDNRPGRAKLEIERSVDAPADADGQTKAADKDNPDNQRSESSNE